MSQELTINCSMNFTKGVLSNNFTIPPQRIDVAGSDLVRETFTVPITATALPLGNITSPGCILIVNRDTTNYVDIAASVADIANPLIRLLPGEGFPFRLAAAAPGVIAHTATCKIEYLLIPN